jgi:3-oxoacyl-[acyl-carrier-protein] synthase-3
LQSLFGLSLSRNKEVKPQDFTLQMNQKAFMEKSSQYTQQLLEKICENQNSRIDHIKIVIPQQLGKFYQHQLTKNGFIPGEIIFSINHRFGFCGAASIPMALYEAVKKEKLTRGDRFLMLGVGAGMSVGGMILTF